MGRGRQKAKHTKLARELKSFSPEVNFASLQRELSGQSDVDDNPELDKWADMADYEPADDVADEYVPGEAAAYGDERETDADAEER